ncbi:hypothetical protein CY0110_18112 [Crocosphaera chwakensis CCY0110]|uniref:Uncharacterized protein n=1 Tax=Crocosphaera chwakensis CCY0110 TaxID=391612 RepID=A3IIV4_9CHRO|nr:hypothetical protein CY0110_18112 [Crocosphaera chwakensis CCY0110]
MFKIETYNLGNSDVFRRTIRNSYS